MISDIYYPTSLLPTEIDEFLEKGWFRLSQAVFTTSYLKFNDVIYSDFWIRINLKTFEISKTQQKLLKQNAHFQVVIKKTCITDEQQQLFTDYKTIVAFDTYDTVKRLLFADGETSIFNDYQVSIYDQNRLIATGFFDLGKQSAEGISCFYHPDYRKYSLGKYLMLQKILYCKDLGFEYFYPGYFAPNYPQFDYKLELAKNATEYFDAVSSQWQSMEFFDKKNTPIKVIKQKLIELSQVLDAYGIPYELLYYDYFDINMNVNFNGLDLLDVPMMIKCEGSFQYEIGIFIYDIIANKYHFMLCEYKFQLSFPREIENHFTNYLLKPTRTLCSNTSADGVVENFLKIVNIRVTA